MKVTGPGSTKNVSKTSKKSKAPSDNAGGNFDSLVSSSGDGAGAVTNTQSIAQVDALLAIQGAEDPTARKTRGRMRARSLKILDILDNIRVKMLTGEVTVGDMIDVADVVASHREKINDPALTDLMDEVDLRAQVEIAKMRVAIEKAG